MQAIPANVTNKHPFSPYSVEIWSLCC